MILVLKSNRLKIKKGLIQKGRFNNLTLLKKKVVMIVNTK